MQAPEPLYYVTPEGEVIEISLVDDVRIKEKLTTNPHGVTEPKLHTEGDRNFNSKFSAKSAWGTWNDYEKVIISGKEYAKVGEWLYTRHAIENLYPSGMGRMAGHTSNHAPVGMPPKLLEDILSNRADVRRTYSNSHPNRIQHDSGDIRIITEKNIVVTVIRTSNGN